MHRVSACIARVLFWSLLTSSAWACAEGEGHRTQDVLSATVPDWSDDLDDVDCRSLLPDSGLSDRDYWKACAELDTRDGGPALADELYRRQMWNLFRQLMTPPYGWRETATRRTPEALPETPLSPEDAADAEDCTDQPSDQLERFAQPPWYQKDWQAQLAATAETPPPPSSEPLWDQHGRLVTFEVAVLNRPEFVTGFSTATKQVQDMCLTTSRSTRWGTLYMNPPRKLAAAMQLKFAWRWIESDQECRDYDFITWTGAPCAAGEYGLVAMHIAIKTNTQGDYWLWGTFSHESNVDEHAGRAPLFRDPLCADCEANRCPPKRNGVRKTQVSRVSAPSEAVRQTKQSGEAAGKIRGAIARYDLVGVQRAPAITGAGDALPAPRPELMANEIIEWDRQDSGCINCHAHARVAAVLDMEKVCASACAAGTCTTCSTDAGSLGLDDPRADSPACLPVTRKSRYHFEPPNKPYSEADMTWIYDHVWNEKEAP